MRFAILVYPGDLKDYEAGGMPGQELLDRMENFNEELVDAGVMVSGEGFHPTSRGARVHFGAGGKITAEEGPFADRIGLIGGYWIWEVKSKAEALEWAKRAPMEDGATLEIRQVFAPSDFGPEMEARETALAEKMAKQRKK